MYCEHFGLKLSPFNNTPDPRFFFNTPDHEEALASLMYAVEQRKGFVLVTGEVGAGKTLLSRLLLNRLGANVRTAMITNTRLTGPELLLAVCREFEIDTEDATTSAELSHRLEEYLLDQYARDRLAVVVIDEAQNLPLEALEELRMLGNLEADDAKLLQILLLGQPELQEAFRHPSLRQTFQRVFRTFHLRALDHALTSGYVAHRLRVGGLSSDRRIFASDAVDAIYKYSEGIPRLINQICDNALLTAYSASDGVVTANLIDEVVTQMMSLTVRSSEAKPQGDFARNMLAMPSSEDRPMGVASPPPSRSTSSAATGSSDWARIDARLRAFESALADVRHESRRSAPSAGDSDANVNDLSGRLDALERGIEAMRRQQSEISEDAGATALRLAEARKLREETVDVLGTASECAKRSQAQIDESIANAELRARDIEKRAAAALAAAEHAQAQVEERTKRLVLDFDSLTSRQRGDVNQALTDSKSETEAVRKLREEMVALQQHVIEAQRSSEARVGQAIGEASEVAKTLESKSRDFLTTAKSQSSELKEQLESLLKDMRGKGEASQARMVELLSQQRTELESAQMILDEYVRAAFARSNIVERESQRVVDELKSQAKDALETVHGVRDRTVARADEVSKKADALIADIAGRVETAHGRMKSLADESEARVGDVVTRLQEVQEKAVKDATEARSMAEQANSDTRKILGETRDSCEALLSQLREHMAEQTKQAEQAWKESSERGAKTIGEIHQRLDAARNAAESSRESLDRVVAEMQSQIDGARKQLAGSLDDHRSEVAALSRDGLALRTDFEQRFDEAKQSLDNLLHKHKTEVGTRVTIMARQTDAAVNEAEMRAQERADALNAQLDATAKKADEIYHDLKDAIEHVERQGTTCQTKYEEAAEKLRADLDGMIERHQKVIAEGSTEIDRLAKSVDGTTGRFQHEMRQMNEMARSRMTQIGKELADAIGKAMSQADAVRKSTEEASAIYGERAAKAQAETAKGVENAEDAIRRIRLQSKSSLEEVRQCLTQMTERADVVKRELSYVGDEIRHATKETADHITQTGARVTSHIETLRETAASEADSNAKRLNTIRQQVETSAEQMRLNAAKLLDQVQSGTAALRRHADDIMTQAQTGSEKLNESASNMMLQAQTSSERFREQAESLLHHAEKMSSGIRDEVQSLRTQLADESDRIRQQIGDARHEIVQSRQETAKIVNDAAESQQRADARAKDLIKRAEGVQSQAESLLSMPRELIDEAKRQAVSLSEMSKKVSSVVRQLNEAGAKAERNKGDLVKAETNADEKIRLLKTHTERVGQLLGIIRQLYGTMDARVERLRGRLSQFDNLFRTVPHELDGLRSVLDAEISRGATGGNGAGGSAPKPSAVPKRAPVRAEPAQPSERMRRPAVAKSVDRSQSNLPDLLHDDSVDESAMALAGAPTPGVQATATASEAPRTSPTPKSAPKPADNKVRDNLQAGSLGEIVQRNEKLQRWLKDMLGDDAVGGSK